LILNSSSQAEYALGHLLYMSDTSLMARPFSPGKTEFAGGNLLVVDGVASLPGAALGLYAASAEGTLIFVRSGVEFSGSVLQLTDLQGTSTWSGEEGHYAELHISPDGKQVAAAIADVRTGTRDIWVLDLAREVSTRFSFTEVDDVAPVWSPDGKRLVFSIQGDRLDLYVKDVGGTQTEHLLYGDEKLELFARSWSRDGRYLAVTSIDGDGRWDNWALEMKDDTVVGELRPLQNTEYDEIAPMISPNGRWMAYVSNETGTFETYVTGFPETGRKWLISSNGGVVPRWSPDGSKLYYMANNGALLEVTIEEAGDSLAVGRPREVFLTDVVDTTNWNYDVLPDGSGFILNTTGSSAGRETPPLTLVLNWTEGVTGR